MIVSSNHEQIFALFSSPTRNGTRKGDGCATIKMDFIVAISGECSETKPDTINLRARCLFCDFLLANCENSKRSRGRLRRVRLSTYSLAWTHLFGNSKGQLEWVRVCKSHHKFARILSRTEENERISALFFLGHERLLREYHLYVIFWRSWNFVREQNFAASSHLCKFIHNTDNEFQNVNDSWIFLHDLKLLRDSLAIFLRRKKKEKKRVTGRGDSKTDSAARALTL